MPNDEHVAMLARGAAVWNEWRTKHDETPDLSRAGLRGLDLSVFDLSWANFRGADLRGTNLSGTNLSAAPLDGANFFKAVLDGADLAGAFLNGAQFLNCAQLLVTGTGNQPSAMTSLPVARLFRIEPFGVGLPVLWTATEEGWPAQPRNPQGRVRCGNDLVHRGAHSRVPPSPRVATGRLRPGRYRQSHLQAGG